jgi:hypothetical protein
MDGGERATTPMTRRGQILRSFKNKSTTSGRSSRRPAARTRTPRRKSKRSDGRSETLSARSRTRTSKITSSVRRYSNSTTPSLEQDTSRRDLRTTIPQTSTTTRSATPSTSTARRSRSGRSKGRSCPARTTSGVTAYTLARDVPPRKLSAARAEPSDSRERKNTKDSTLDVRTTYRSRSSSASPISTDTTLRRSSTGTTGRSGPPTRTGY